MVEHKEIILILCYYNKEETTLIVKEGLQKLEGGKDMIKVCWEQDEAVALFDVYFKNYGSVNVSEEILNNLRDMYIKRIKDKGVTVDEKFRNLSGLRMQLGCIHYVVTGGKEGMSNASKLFYDTYELYKNNPDTFQQILDCFYNRYSY